MELNRREIVLKAVCLLGSERLETCLTDAIMFLPLLCLVVTVINSLLQLPMQSTGRESNESVEDSSEVPTRTDGIPLYCATLPHHSSLPSFSSLLSCRCSLPPRKSPQQLYSVFLRRRRRGYSVGHQRRR